jgi:hypothetical protein
MGRVRCRVPTTTTSTVAATISARPSAPPTMIHTAICPLLSRCAVALERLSPMTGSAGREDEAISVRVDKRQRTVSRPIGIQVRMVGRHLDGACSSQSLCNLSQTGWVS